MIWLTEVVDRAGGLLLTAVILAAVALGVAGAVWAVRSLWKSDVSGAGEPVDVPLDDLIESGDMRVVLAELGSFVEHSAVVGVDVDLVVLADGRTVERSAGQPWHVYTGGVRDWSRRWDRVDDAVTAALFDQWLTSDRSGGMS